MPSSRKSSPVPRFSSSNIAISPPARLDPTKSSGGPHIHGLSQDKAPSENRMISSSQPPSRHPSAISGMVGGSGSLPRRAGAQLPGLVAAQETSDRAAHDIQQR